MRKIFLIGLTAALALPGCSEPENDPAERLATADMAASSSEVQSEAASQADMTAPPVPAASGMREIADRPQIPVAMPRMAYVYDYGYRLEGTGIAALQQKHADMCAAMGPYSCQIVSLEHSGADEELVTGSLELAVVADKARDFGKRLSETAGAADAEEIASTIQGEDLSKAIVDTEARLRSRIVLRDRLMEVLQTRRGTVAELVEAERGVAQVNEEIDQARSWLEEMKGRVAYSRVKIAYESNVAASGGFVAPVRGAISSLGSVMGALLAALIYLLAIGGPIGLAVLAGRAVMRKLPDRAFEAEA